jgi:hypothetical protein
LHARKISAGALTHREILRGNSGTLELVDRSKIKEAREFIERVARFSE